MSSMKQNKRVKRFLRKVNSSLFHVDTDAMIHQIETLHANRIYRGMAPEKLMGRFQKKFIEASMQNSAYRSQIVSMKMKCFKVHASIEKNLSSLKKYLKYTYSEDLKKTYKTQADRDSAIDFVFLQVLQYKKDLEMVMGLCDIVVADIDATGWSMKDVKSVMEMAFEKRVSTI